MKAAALVVFVVMAWFGLKSAAGQDNCEGWISTGCCCSNSCCFVVEPGTVEAVDHEHYRIIASGQIIKRTGWSMNGRFMRCACDQIEGKWTIHPTAFTRCIYPPIPSS